MIKDELIILLQMIEKEYKRGCEQSTYEEDRDLYGKWHDQIVNMIKTIKSGGIK